jgi:hypothetical protein
MYRRGSDRMSIITKAFRANSAHVTPPLTPLIFDLYKLHMDMYTKVIILSQIGDLNI